MIKKQNKTDIELKHFIRANSHAVKREMVVEHVTAGSTSFKFLQRMEERRKKQECVRSIDMRGRVPYECKSHIHNNQVFWMDDISFRIFQKGLKENNNVFTNQIFEDIMNGEHTSNSIKRSANAQQLPEDTQVLTAGQGSGTSLEDKFKIEGQDAHLINLGYYRRRYEKRLKHSTEVLVHASGKTIAAKTRDISSKGLQLSFNQPIRLNKDDDVYLTFTGLNNSYSAKLFDIKYRVLDMEYVEPEFRLRVLYNHEKDDASDFLTDFISKQLESIRGRKKIDIEDIRLTSESLLTELYYTNTTPSIPFFIHSENSQLSLKTVCINKINKPLLECFRNKNNILDLSSLSSFDRVKQLSNYTQDDGQKDPLMVVYRSKQGAPCVMFSYEFDSLESWECFVASKIDDKNIKIFKVILRTVAKPDARKIKSNIEKLKSKSEDSVVEVLNFSNYIIKAGVFIDISSEFIKSINKKTYEESLLNNAIKSALNSEKHNGPAVDIIEFDYKEQRREDRYHVQVDAIIHIGSKNYKGVTLDLSIKGLSVRLESSNIELLRKGDVINLDLPVLHKRANERIQLVDIPYTITCINYEGKFPVLHLMREKTKYWSEQTDFFKDLIQRNIKLIKLDTKDIETAAKSKLISSIAVENTATLPLFIVRDAEANSKKISIAMPPQPSQFSEFFEVEPGVYDFRAISHPNRLSRLSGKIRNTEISELVIYMYKKQIPGIAKFNIYSAIDAEFDGNDEREAFFAECLANDYCFIKISVSRVQKPQDLVISAAIEKLQEYSSHYAQRLLKEYNNTLAIGDITDISNQINLIPEIASQQKEEPVSV